MCVCVYKRERERERERDEDIVTFYLLHIDKSPFQLFPGIGMLFTSVDWLNIKQCLYYYYMCLY